MRLCPGGAQNAPQAPSPDLGGRAFGRETGGWNSKAGG